jgi:hypothetical protein
MIRMLSVLLAAIAIAVTATPAAAQRYNYGPPPLGGPIGAILDGIFGPLPPPPPPYYEYGPPQCYGCPPPPPPRYDPPQARPREKLGGPYTREREDAGDY